MEVNAMFQCLFSFFQLLIIFFICFAVSSPALATNSNQVRSGLEQLSQGNYNQARLIFDEILTTEGEQLEARRYRCFAHLNLGNYQQSIDDCSSVIAQDSTQLEAYLWRGLAYYRHGNYQEAIRNYNQLLQRHPNYPQALYNRGLAESGIKLFPQAIADYNQALQFQDHLSQEEKAMIYNDRGIAYLQQHQYEKAREDFSQAIVLDKTDSRSFYNLGCVCHYLGEHKTAIEHFTKSLEKAPNNPATYISRGLAFYELDYTEIAIEDLTTGANLFKVQGNSQAAAEIQSLIWQIKPTTSVLNYI